MFLKVERAGAPYNVSQALSIFVGRREFLLIPPYRIASTEGCQWTSFHQLLQIVPQHFYRTRQDLAILKH